MEERPQAGVPLTADEWHVLSRYREIKAAGQGMMVIEFAAHRCTKYEYKHAGDVRMLNSLIGELPLRD